MGIDLVLNSLELFEITFSHFFSYRELANDCVSRVMLGICGWKSRLCTLVLGLGIYLFISALISTRRLNFPAYGDPLIQFRHLPPDDAASQSKHQIHSVNPALRHHHPRNLASAVEKIAAHQHRLPPRKLRNGPQIEWCNKPPLVS